MYVTLSEGPVRLHTLTDCPLYEIKKGLCFQCNYYLGLNTSIFREGRCGVNKIHRKINDFCNRTTCPDEKQKEKGANCNQCQSFLGFKNNEVFYCASQERK